MAPRKKDKKGSCFSCGTEMKKNVMTEHLASCPTRSAAIVKSNTNSEKSERLFHLHVEAMYDPEMWFDIEVRGGALLRHLDYYILEIWLQCCFHRSYFSTSPEPFFPGGRLSKKGTIESFFLNENSNLFHFYDNCSSQCVITCHGVRHGTPLTKYPMVLLARNTPNVWKCNLCEKPATEFCSECVGPSGEGFFCDEHIYKSPDHRCAADDGLHVHACVNSPRMGICGYDGPAEPPY